MKKLKVAFLETPIQRGPQKGHYNFAYVLVASTEKCQKRQPEGAPKVDGKKYKLVALHSAIKATVKVGDTLDCYPTSGDIFESEIGASADNNMTKLEMSQENTMERSLRLIGKGFKAVREMKLSEIEAAELRDAAKTLGLQIVVEQKANTKAKAVAWRSGMNFGQQPVVPNPNVPAVDEN